MLLQFSTKKKKTFHEINPDDLNKCAKNRLDDMNLEVDKILDMHLNGKNCLYGYIRMGVCYLLWYDTDHGDNDHCVCRSFKQGNKKKHDRA